MNTCNLKRHAARGRARQAGLSLGELIVALAISASILVGAAVSSNAAFDAYQINQEQSSLMQRARLAEHRMLSAVREGTEHVPYTVAKATSFRAGLNVTDTGIEMETPEGKTLAFRYDAPTKRLMVDQEGQPTRVLLEGVEQFQVTLEPMRSATNLKAGLSYDLLRRATILLAVRSSTATSVKTESIGHQTVTISSAVVPRRNAW